VLRREKTFFVVSLRLLLIKSMAAYPHTAPGYYGRRFAYPRPAETIYNLIPRPASERSKPSMYRSKYPHDTPPTSSTFGPTVSAQMQSTNLAGSYNNECRVHRHKAAGATFGPKQDHYSDPTSWLPSDSKPDLPPPRRFEYSDRRKEKVDTMRAPQTFVQQKQVSSNRSKNFLTENALSVIMADARKPKDDKVNYLKKADFGQVPSYLGSIKQEIEGEKAYVRAVMEQEAAEMDRAAPKMRLLSPEEQNEILNSLKNKWEQVNRTYQGMTHLVTLDTVGKIRKKEEYERQLEQLEKSIERLSKPQVFVQDVNGQPAY